MESSRYDTSYRGSQASKRERCFTSPALTFITSFEELQPFSLVGNCVYFILQSIIVTNLQVRTLTLGEVMISVWSHGSDRAYTMVQGWKESHTTTSE